MQSNARAEDRSGRKQQRDAMSTRTHHVESGAVGRAVLGPDFEPRGRHGECARRLDRAVDRQSAVRARPRRCDRSSLANSAETQTCKFKSFIYFSKFVFFETAAESSSLAAAAAALPLILMLSLPGSSVELAAQPPHEPARWHPPALACSVRRGEICGPRRTSPCLALRRCPLSACTTRKRGP